jgi:hypothetical protein
LQPGNWRTSNRRRRRKRGRDRTASRVMRSSARLRRARIPNTPGAEKPRNLANRRTEVYPKRKDSATQAQTQTHYQRSSTAGQLPQSVE